MHELAVTQNVLEIALRYAKKEGEPKIIDVFLVIGQLSSIVDDSVQFYWEIVSKGTLAEGAKLHFQRVSAVFQCLDCQHQYSLKENIVCPLCHSNNIRVTAGDEFYLEAIDVSE